jgi:acyl-CoA reductase-like NAD-dependent aldehyde dehydrogenase
MLRDQYPYYVAGRPEQPNTALEVLDKYRGTVATRVALADRAAVERGIAAAAAAVPAMRAMRGYERKAVLRHCVDQFHARFDELAHALCIEAGKPIHDSRGEVTRLIDTFEIAAEEAVRMYGEVQPLDISARARDYTSMWKRVPIGPCSFITPFNFPLNLVAHKVAPALAVGCPFVLKPAPRTPVGALILGEILAETDLPPGAFSVLPTTNEDAAPFVEDERLALLSFTGSEPVGWLLKAKAGKKKVVLELGGDAAVIVDEGADLDDVIPRLVMGVFYQSGQSCISVQRVLAHASLYDELRARLVAATVALKAGDPLDPETFVGPVISAHDAERIAAWVREAVAGGARLLCGGTHDGVMVAPTLLEDVPRGCKLDTEEVFGPVAHLRRFEQFDEALALVNRSRFGIHAGVFTRDLYRAHRAWDELEVGGVLIGDVPSFRVDAMPYGGVKSSGIGREGVRFAMEDMTEIRSLTIRTPPARA